MADVATATATPAKVLPPTLEERLQFLGNRRATIQKGLKLSGVGLEISPNWAPLVTKNEANVHYCDLLTYEELCEREKDNPGRIDNGLEVMPLDFTLKEGSTIAERAPAGVKYDFICSSHVMEHVPDFLGFLYEQRDVLTNDGIIAFVLPNSKGSGEYFRNLTIAADLLSAYLLRYTRPSPAMVYEARKHIFPWKNVPLDGKTLNDVDPFFGPEICFNDARRSMSSYQDAHCWAFTLPSFIDVMNELKVGGYFNFEFVDVTELPVTASGYPSEFYIKLRPTAPKGANTLRGADQPMNTSNYDILLADARKQLDREINRPLTSIIARRIIRKLTKFTDR